MRNLFIDVFVKCKYIQKSIFRYHKSAVFWYTPFKIFSNKNLAVYYFAEEIDENLYKNPPSITAISEL